MRVLLTNHSLAERSGTELYLRDVALALLARGHEPVAYSRRLGEVAQELRRATVPVIDDLEQLGRAPDLIHAQHHLEAMTALARFPEAPAVYVCHGWLPDEEAPPKHPQILSYVAVDALVRERLRDECGIAEDRIRLLLNFVDLRRFRPRPPLPKRPARALVFSNYVSEQNCLDAIRHACDLVGLELDVIGRDHGAPADKPEDLIGAYDLIFAKGRSALEAAAVGTAVVLCDVAGLGPIINSRELDRQRAFNFGVRLLREEVTTANVLARLERYDAEDAAEVCRRMAEEAGLDTCVDRLLALYEEALLAAREVTASPEDRAKALAFYLRHGPLRGGDFHAAERERLLANAAHQKARAAELRLAADGLRSKCQRQEETASSFRGQLANLREQSRIQQAALVTLGRGQKEAIEDAKAERAVCAQRQRRILELEAETDRLRAAESESAGRIRELKTEMDRLRGVEDESAGRIRELESARKALEAGRQSSLQSQERILRDSSAALERESQAREQAEARAERLATELGWIEKSWTWRLRRALLALPGVATAFRLIARRGLD